MEEPPTDREPSEPRAPEPRREQAEHFASRMCFPPALSVLDLTYTNLKEHSLPRNLFCLTTLRALYLSAHDFEILPPDTGKLKVASIG